MEYIYFINSVLIFIIIFSIVIALPKYTLYIVLFKNKQI